MKKLSQQEIVEECNNISKLKSEIERNFEKEKQTYERVSKDINKKYKELQKQCTHKYPDGTSAYENGDANGYCKICLIED